MSLHGDIHLLKAFTNIHDSYGYPSPGGVNWGGDSACIFSVDSPNFGGLICSSTVISADMWKLGQLKPGDTFNLVPVSLDNAVDQIHVVEELLSAVEISIHGGSAATPRTLGITPRTEVVSNASILKTVSSSPESPLRPGVTYRQVGAIANYVPLLTLNFSCFTY